MPGKKNNRKLGLISIIYAGGIILHLLIADCVDKTNILHILCSGLADE